MVKTGWIDVTGLCNCAVQFGCLVTLVRAGGELGDHLGEFFSSQMIHRISARLENSPEIAHLVDVRVGASLQSSGLPG